MAVALEGSRRWFQASALGIEHVVDDDAVEPRAEAAPSLERRQPGERLDQDLLRGILGVLRVIEHTDSDVIDPGLVAADQILEGLAIAGLDPDDERAVVVVDVGALGEGVRHDHVRLQGDEIGTAPRDLLDVSVATSPYLLGPGMKASVTEPASGARDAAARGHLWQTRRTHLATPREAAEVLVWSAGRHC